VGFALRDFWFIEFRRTAALWTAAALTVIVGLGVVVESTKYGVPAPAVPLAVAVPMWLAFTKRAGLALVVVMVYMGLLDGVVKLSTGSQVATLGRDALLYAVAIGMAARSRGPRRMPALSGWVFAWGAAILVQVANPGNLSIFHAVASTRQDLEFVPLFFIGFAVVRTKSALYTFLAVLLAIAGINGVVGAYQSTLTPAQLGKWGNGYEALLTGPSARTFQGAHGQAKIRPPALGSDEGFGGVLGAAALPGGIVLLIAFRRRRVLLALIVLGLVGATVGVLTSQARSAVIMAVVSLLAVLALVGVGRQAGRALIALLVVGAIAFVGVEVTSSYSQNAFARFSSIAPGSAGSTVVSYRSSTWATVPVYMREIPFGAGLGLVGSAAGKAGISAAKHWDAESEFTYLIIEAGIPGLLVLVGFQFILFRTVVTGLRRERDPEVVLLMAGVAAPLFGYFAGWFVGVYTAETPGDAYLWFAAGILNWWLLTRQREMGARAPGQHEASLGRKAYMRTAGALNTTA
jgi:hypothetical protein